MFLVIGYKFGKNIKFEHADTIFRTESFPERPARSLRGRSKGEAVQAGFLCR